MKYCDVHKVNKQEVEATCGYRKFNGAYYFLCQTCADAFELGQTHKSVTLDSIEDIEAEEEREEMDRLGIRPGPEFEYEDYYKM